MGNTIASEGEDMADSPRVPYGEISKKSKKHRSWRKKLYDKMTNRKKVKSPKKETPEYNVAVKEHKESIKESPQEINKRRNYYQTLGIAHKGSRESEKSPIGSKRYASLLDGNAFSEDHHPLENKSHSFISVSKSPKLVKTQRGKSPEFGETRTPNKSQKHAHYDFSDAIEKNRNENETKESRQMETSTRATDNTCVKNSMSEHKEDDIENEEDKFGDSQQSGLSTIGDSPSKETEDFKMDIFTRNQGKTDEAMRRKFLSRLTQEKVWLTPSEKPKAHQT
jgi:hypothetical protein